MHILASVFPQDDKSNILMKMDIYFSLLEYTPHEVRWWHENEPSIRCA